MPAQGRQQDRDLGRRAGLAGAEGRDQEESFSFSKGATNVTSWRFGPPGQLGEIRRNLPGEADDARLWHERQEGAVGAEGTRGCGDGEGVTHCAVSRRGEDRGDFEEQDIVVLRPDGGADAKDLTLQSLQVLPTCFAFAYQGTTAAPATRTARSLRGTCKKAGGSSRCTGTGPTSRA